MKILETIGAVVVTAVLFTVFGYAVMLFSILMNGYVGFIMWGWFAPDIVKGIATNMWEFIFLYMTIGIFKKNGKVDSYETKSTKEIIKGIIVTFLIPWVTLLAAWVIKNKFWVFEG